MRVVYEGADDIRALRAGPDRRRGGGQPISAPTPRPISSTTWAASPQYRTDPELCEILVTRSKPTLLWMRDRACASCPNYGRQAYRVDGRFKFWGGRPSRWRPAVRAWSRRCTARPRGAASRSSTSAWAQDLIPTTPACPASRSASDGETARCAAKAVVLACGGFEANAEWRTRYLGPGWDLAKVRGTRFNTGDGLAHGADASARSPTATGPAATPSAWERNAAGIRRPGADGDDFQRHSYPFGVMVNAEGKRFVDEGADFRNYTYAKYGRAMLAQPGQFAWQVFDAKVPHLLRDEYRMRQRDQGARRHAGGAGAQARGGRPGRSCWRRSREFNAAVTTRRAVRSQRQGRPRRARPGVPRSNWANPHRYAAVRGLCGHLRRHLHLRRPARSTREGQVVGHRAAPRSPACSPPARWSAGSSTSTIPAAAG